MDKYIYTLSATNFKIIYTLNNILRVIFLFMKENFSLFERFYPFLKEIARQARDDREDREG